VLLIAETTLVHNTNAFNVVTLSILNGIAPSTLAEHAIEWHLDMHLGHVKDKYTMMESMDIMKLMGMTMETSPESSELYKLFVYIYFPNHLNSQAIFLFHHSPFLPFLLS
jgi:hypothetical protein